MKEKIVGKWTKKIVGKWAKKLFFSVETIFVFFVLKKQENQRSKNTLSPEIFIENTWLSYFGSEISQKKFCYQCKKCFDENLIFFFYLSTEFFLEDQKFFLSYFGSETTLFRIRNIFFISNARWNLITARVGREERTSISKFEIKICLLFSVLVLFFLTI